MTVMSSHHQPSTHRQRNKQLPHPRWNVLAHGVLGTVPTIEVADDLYAFGIGSPDGKIRPHDFIHGAQVRSHLVVELPVATFSKQEQIELEREQDELTKMEDERLKQLEDIRKQREAAEKTRKIEEQKLAMLKDRNHQADAEKQRDLENQRMEQLAAEEAQRAGTNGRDESLLGQYKLAITTLVDRNWLRPDTLREGFRCNVTLTQIIGGEVIAVDTSSCAGDPLVVRSLEAAVQREPLPYRGFESVFVRKVTIPFCYPREICIQ